jgi:hypothetical protein
MNASFVGLRRLRVDSITTSTPDTLVFVVTVNGTSKLSVKIAVDAQGLISHPHLQPAGGSSPSPKPTTSSSTAPDRPDGRVLSAAALALRSRPRRLTDDKGRRELDPQSFEPLALQEADQQADAHPAELGERLTDGGQVGRHDRIPIRRSSVAYQPA